MAHTGPIPSPKVNIGLRVDLAVYEAIQAARGEQSMNAWIENALKAAVKGKK